MRRWGEAGKLTFETLRRIEFTEEVVDTWSRRRGGEPLATLGATQKLLWIGRTAEAALAQVARRIGFQSRGEYEVVALLLRTEPHLLTAVEAAQRLMMSSAGMSNRVNSLERQGLLVRLPDPKDRRAARLHLTADGRSLAEEAFAGNLSIYQRALDGLTQTEVKEFDRLLGQVLDRWDQILRSLD